MSNDHKDADLYPLTPSPATSRFFGPQTPAVAADKDGCWPRRDPRRRCRCSRGCFRHDLLACDPCGGQLVHDYDNTFDGARTQAPGLLRGPVGQGGPAAFGAFAGKAGNGPAGSFKGLGGFGGISTLGGLFGPDGVIHGNYTRKGPNGA